tara:strand:+ start:381 stop:530 length:150 start_codon:yes stop_codon:yes gene_type:complete
MGFFDLFKDKKKNLLQLSMVLLDQGLKSSKYGKWNKDLSFGESFIKMNI